MMTGKYPAPAGVGITASNPTTFSGVLDAGPAIITAETVTTGDLGSSFAVALSDANGNAIGSTQTYTGAGFWRFAVGAGSAPNATVTVTASGSYSRISVTSVGDPALGSAVFQQQSV